MLGRCSWWMIGLCCLLLGVAVEGYKSGAPAEVCGDMTPQHGGVQPQTTPSPYKIKLSRNRIKPGESIDITVSGNRNDLFKGFMLEARVGKTPIGQFTPNRNAKTIDCGSAKQNAVTHTGPEQKRSVSVTWTAPRDLKEQVIVYATVAKNGGEFWVGVKSDPISVI